MIMRGGVAAAGGADNLGGGPATRSLMELDMTAGGRTSRNSDYQNTGTASGPGLSRAPNRPGSGLGRPINYSRTGGVDDAGLSFSERRARGLAGPNKFDSNASQGGLGGNMGPPMMSGANSNAPGGGTGLGEAKGHKSRSSLASSMGKFASGIASRSSGSRDRKNDDAAGGATGGKKDRR